MWGRGTSSLGTPPERASLYTGGYVGARILGNKIGTSRTGLAALPNLYGVDVGNFGTATIGDTGSGEGNLISGNTNSGIRLRGPDSVVQNNRIGLSSGIGPLGNGQAGIEIGVSATTTNNTIGGRGPGEGNVIARNGGAGIDIQDSANTVVGNEISGNSIFNNFRLGITVGGSVAPRPNDAGDPDLGPNRGQNYPVLSAASTTAIDGSLDSVAGNTYAIEFFANAGCDPSGHGEGSRYLGAMTGQAPGAFSFDPAGSVAVGEVIAATATNESTGDTSEFSACVTAVSGDASSFTVTTTDDTVDAGGCTTSHCSLREAITRANSETGTDTIDFEIGAALIAGAHTIRPNSALPTISDPVIIDGTTDPDAGSCPDGQVIELDGTNAGPATDGLTVSAGGSTIRGLVINRFNGDGIRLTTAGGNTVTCTYLGVGVDGITALGNGQDGIDADGGAGNTIGGTGAGDRNVVSGNIGVGILVGPNGTSTTSILGNTVGLGADGTTTVSNAAEGIRFHGTGTIGDGTSGGQNVVSGNHGTGIDVAGNFAFAAVLGNRVGTDAAGQIARPNALGINVSGNGSNVGGSAPGAGNLVSGNSGVGIRVRVLNGGNRVEG